MAVSGISMPACQPAGHEQAVLEAQAGQECSARQGGGQGSPGGGLEGADGLGVRHQGREVQGGPCGEAPCVDVRQGVFRRIGADAA